MMRFRYSSHEDRLHEVVTTIRADWPTDEALHLRGQLLLWAHLYPEAAAQASAHAQAIDELFAKRIEAADRYFRHELAGLQELERQWSPAVVELHSPTLFELKPKAAYHSERPAISFGLEGRGYVVARTTGRIAFPSPRYYPTSPTHAAELAHQLVQQALAALAPFEGKTPAPLPA